MCSKFPQKANGSISYSSVVIFSIFHHFLFTGHNNTIGCVRHSPTAAAFVSCSDDFRARFWYSEGI